MKHFYKIQSRCVLCQSDKLSQVLNLGKTPIANKLESTRSLQIEEEFFPLRLGICLSCRHLQLLDIIDGGVLFANYPYVSNINKSTAKRFSDLSQLLYDKFCTVHSNYESKPFVIEIGSNDGFLLQRFQEKSCEVLGIDPATEATQIADQNGVPTITDFFSYELAQKISNNYSKPDLIVANNVLAHSDDLFGIFEGIKLLMSNESVLVIEFSYALDIFKKLLIDTVYHEHMSYHSIIPIQRFLENLGMRIFDVEKFDAHGGSARIYVCLKDSSFVEQPSVKVFVALEEDAGLHDVESWEILSKRLRVLSNSISSEISKIKNLGYSVSGYGVPAKFATLFHSLQMSEKDFSHIYDDNESKIGKYAPGTNIQIEPSSNLSDSRDCYLLIFSWNYSEEIIAKLKANYPAVKGVLVPLPELALVSF